MRLLEQTAPVRRRVGEGPPAVPEELGLEEILGDRAAVDGDEGQRRAAGASVDGARDELLAGAALSRDEDRRLEVGDLRDRPEDVEHLLALREDGLELVLLVDLLSQGAVLAPQRLALFCLSQREDDLVRLERLADVVVGPRLHRLDGEVHVAVRAHDDDRRRMLLRLERRQHVETSHARHAHVRQDDVGVERVDERQRRLAAVGNLDLEAMLLEEGAQDEANVLLVIDDQYAAHGTKTLQGQDT